MAELYDAILTGNMPAAVEVSKAALEAGDDVQALVQEQMIPAMDEVGARFERNEYYVPQLIVAARAMKESLAVLTPALLESGAESAGRVVFGTVKGDNHDIGKNLVASLLEGAGFEVIDLGINVATEKFVEAVTGKEGTILAMSALLTTTMCEMQKVIEALTEAGVREQVKVIIGGAPVTQQFADQIGADGYSDNASAAVTLARGLVTSA